MYTAYTNKCMVLANLQLRDKSNRLLISYVIRPTGFQGSYVSRPTGYYSAT